MTLQHSHSEDTDCQCQCRTLGRSFERARKLGFVGPSGDLDNLLSNMEGMYIFDCSDWYAPELTYDEWLAQTFSDEDVVRMSQLLSECKCCERHQKDRAEVLLPKGGFIKSTSKN